MADTHKKDKEKEAPREPPAIPNVNRPDLFAWIEALFAEEIEFPMKIELRQVSGRGCIHMSEGVFKLWQHSPGKARPPREALVSLSNEIAAAAQDDCNGIGKLQRYGVFAYHPKKGEKWYDRKILRLYPKDGVRPDDEGDDEPGGRNRIVESELDHLKFKDRQVDESTANLLDHYSARLDKVEAMNDKFTEKLSSVFEKVTDQFVKFMTATEAALSQASTRQAEAEMRLFKMEMLRKGANLVESLAPAGLNAVIGQKVLPEGKSLVAKTCEAFLNGLTREQRDAVLGVIDTEGRIVTPGVFTFEQVKLFFSLAEGSVPDERIDDFFEGGPCEIKTDQYLRAMKHVPPEQFAGVKSVADQRREAKEKARRTSG